MLVLIEIVVIESVGPCRTVGLIETQMLALIESVGLYRGWLL